MFSGPRSLLVLALLWAAPASAQDATTGAGGDGGRRNQLGCSDDDETCARRKLLEQIDRTLAALRRTEAAEPREVRNLGLAVLVGSASLPRRSEATHALALSSAIAIDATDPRRHLTVRGRGLGRYGDGNASFVLHHQADFAVGRVFDLTDQRGVVARGGFRYQFRGDQQFLSSMIALPEAQLGYEVRPSKGKKIEVAARAAPVLVGRYKVADDGARKLGQELSWGAHASVWLGHVDLDIEWTRIQPVRHATLAPLDQVSLWLCSRGVPLGFEMKARFDRREAHLSMCAEGRLWQGELRQQGAPVEARASQVAFMVGIE